MACSQFEYVKAFEQHLKCLQNTWMVVRIDGHAFHRFTKAHNFEKPNDLRGLQLANHAAQQVMIEFNDIILAYGQSDEFSFVLKKESLLYDRREFKIVSSINSLFTSNYALGWNLFFPDLKLEYAPSFDARIVTYPSDRNLVDYLSWRQVDCHINNLYNTSFWALVKSGKTEKQAEKILKDTDSAKKNELLFQDFGINYNKLPEIYRKGSVLYRKKVDSLETSATGQPVTRKRTRLVTEHVDLIKPNFWTENAHLNVLCSN